MDVCDAVQRAIADGGAAPTIGHAPRMGPHIRAMRIAPEARPSPTQAPDLVG